MHQLSRLGRTRHVGKPHGAPFHTVATDAEPNLVLPVNSLTQLVVWDDCLSGVHSQVPSQLSLFIRELKLA